MSARLAVREILAVGAFLPRALIAAAQRPPPADTALLTLRLVSRSAPVVFVVAFFGGAMLTMQAAVSLAAMGGGEMAGLVVGFGGIREVFPLLAASSVAARSGAEFASELGTMKTTQQVDALDAMGLDPLRMLVAPRVLAATLGTPLCVLLACAAGMLGAQTVGTLQLGLDPGTMRMHLWSGVGPHDLGVGTLKGAVLGFLLGAVSSREGLSAAGGAAGVGRATNRAVVRAMVLVCLSSLGLTTLIYGPRL